MIHKPFQFLFGAVRFFLKIFPSKVPPSILLKSPFVISGVKRYIRTFDVISELYCAFVRWRRRFENRSFHENVLGGYVSVETVHFANCCHCHSPLQLVHVLSARSTQTNRREMTWTYKRHIS